MTNNYKWKLVSQPLYQEDSNDEKRLEVIRIFRDKLLLESDWTQLPDNEMSDSAKEAWKQYRSELRHLPDTYTNIYEFVFPEVPDK